MNRNSGVDFGRASVDLYYYFDVRRARVVEKQKDNFEVLTVITYSHYIIMNNLNDNKFYFLTLNIVSE